MSTQSPDPQNPYPQQPYPQQPYPQPYAQQAPRPSRPFYRPADGRMLGGVCAAIADHFGWDRSLVRIATVASLFLPGPQVLAYLAAWIIVPDEQKYWERQAAAAQPYPSRP